MGCATSKEVARKRAERESWYAPVSRSLSAPIHYPAESDDDSCHVVSLASSSYGIIELEKPGDPINKGSFVRILQDKHVILEEKRHSVDSGKQKSLLKCHTKLKPVQEVPENENGDLETINTWELMEGLDEDGGGKTPSPLVATARPRCFEKSLSFSTVQELDSGFSEIGSPVLKKYLYLNEPEGIVGGSSPASKKKLGFGHHSSLSFSGAEDQLCGGYAGYAKTQSSPRMPLKSPTTIQTPAKSPAGSPIKSPLSKSPTMNSPLIGSSSGSPLFDPSIMATFEQALQAIALPQDDWSLLHDPNEESLTNSSASSGNNTWVLSETSSDAESCPQLESMEAHEASSLCHSVVRKQELSSKVSPWNGTVKMGKYERTLDSFDLRCPPRGEEKVVLYFTSLRGIRKTYEDCCELRLILQGFGVHVDERDVWMHSKFREELTELLQSKRVQVPRLFIKGRDIGGADDVKHLHEDGLLVGLIEDLPCLGMFRKVCQGCADVRFIPCLTCCGSCKVLDAMDQTARCDKCNENGLIMCPLCS